MSSVDETWRQAVMPVGSNIKEVITNLNEVAIKIVLVVNNAQELVGTISDGDIRRGLLNGLNLDSPITNVINRNPLVVPQGMDRDSVMQLMGINKVQQIPVVDNAHQLVGLHFWDEIVAPETRPNMMVIMAGGKGTRLLPHTESRPKPMVPVAGKPMLEHLISRAKFEGFSQFVIAIHHLGNMIEDYFGDGSHLGVAITYLREHSPMGTAGALGLLERRPETPFIVTNADVITDVRYGEIVDFHLHHKATATIAIRAHEWQNPFGVVQTQGIEIVGFEEKPIVRSNINTGVYVLSPEALDSLPSNAACDMPALFERIITSSKRTVAYPMHEPWLDVGSPKDLAKANSIDPQT